MNSNLDFLRELGIEGNNQGAYAGTWLDCQGPVLESRNPATGELIARVHTATRAEYERCVEAAGEVFARWRTVPAPVRGEVVRKVGLRLRERKEALGKLITLEMGKILQEGLGEVQEAIDIADFAVGQSRMLYGLSMHSERPGHAMREQWQPARARGLPDGLQLPHGGVGLERDARLGLRRLDGVEALRGGAALRDRPDQRGAPGARGRGLRSAGGRSASARSTRSPRRCSTTSACR